MRGKLDGRKIRGAVFALVGSMVSAAQAQAQSHLPTDPSACVSLAGTEIRGSEISLPTRGATVTSATLVTPANGGAYCSVDGKINSVHPAAGPIEFNVAMPVNWNGRALHLMGGGWDGFVVKGSGPVVGAETLSPPVARGYVAFGSDSGHKYSDPDWQLNDEALENFAGDQLRKTRDAAMAIVRKHYGIMPKRTYSAGGSGGGREALYVADRWPQLYDGVIAFYPVWSAVGSFIGWIDNAQELAKPGAWSNPAQQQAISKAVVAHCDKLDGLEDGLVGNISACRFEPAWLQCGDQSDSSDTCLTKAQVDGLVRAYGTSKKLPFKLPNDVRSFQAYDVLTGGAQPRMGKTPPGEPITPSKSFNGPEETAFGAVLSDPFVRFAVTRDPSASVFSFRADATPEIKDRMLYLSRRMDVDPTMKSFVSKGGKILLVHGNADQVDPAKWSDELYRRAVSAYGKSKTKRHLRYYRIPGYGHGIGLRHGANFDLQVDLLTALENWVEHNQPPVGIIGTDANPQRKNRTRPLCEYPRYAKYKGSGDQNVASSFECAL